jgi:PAS domain S-box-containing protein
MNPELAAEALQALAGILPLAIIGLDARGLVDFWSPGAASRFGWSEAETLGKPLPLETKDGRLLPTDFRKAGRTSGGVLLAEAAVDARSYALLEAAPDAIIEVDRQGRIVLLNQVAEKLFGYSRDELLGASVDLLLPESVRGLHAMHRAGYASHPTTRPMGQRMQLSAQCRDGSELPVEISLSPVVAGDSFTVMAIIRDVSERRRFDQQIRRAHEELEARNREVENANQLKSEFLASVSHELRTPLHTIIGFTELLEEERQGALNTAQKRFVGHVHRDSIHLLELINDILDLSKIEANKMELRMESFDAYEAVREVLQSSAPTAEAKGLALEDRMQKPVHILADRVRFREIVTNLLSNAVKFTPKGGRVWAELSPLSTGNAAISISDTGVGIDRQDQEVIFERFRQVGPASSGVREGTGLGLAIARRLAEMHGGSLTVESEPGRGSKFIFTIPLDPDQQPDEPLVLIIEDDPAGRELLASYLQPMGIRTRFAETAEEGIGLARRLRPDAITLDLVLPDGDGWRVLEQLRALPETSKVPVFVVSVLDRDSCAIARGATEYLEKPLSRDVLLRALRLHAPERFGYLAIESS